LAGKRNKPQPQKDTDPLVHKVGLVANLLALHVAKDIEGEGDKVGMLDAAGFSNQEIAALLGKDVNTINVTLFRRRNTRKK
jgi:hypothetical protein